MSATIVLCSLSSHAFLDLISIQFIGLEKKVMNYKTFLGAASTALMIAIAILMLAPGALAASKYKTLYKFKGGTDGNQPIAGVAFDNAGNLYGTTQVGGSFGHGTVFQLEPSTSGGWKKTMLHSFTGKGGSNPYGDLIMDAQGSLYGTTIFGGKGACNGRGCGVAFELKRSANGSWKEKVLSYFSGNVGVNPAGGLIVDETGSLYGTTTDWSYSYTGPGTVFKLIPNSDGSWKKSTLHTFDNTDGYNPSAGLSFDPAGNLYSTTDYGGVPGEGVVFQLTPNSDGTWTESVLYSFTGGSDGWRPQGRPVRDSAGNLYGVTTFGGQTGCGVVWELTPNSDGSWTESTTHTFTGGNDGCNPWGTSLVLDGAGTLYGTTYAGGLKDYGVVFKLTPDSNGTWKETLIHTFVDSPGCNSFSSLMFDATGNLYGTTGGDGTTTFGSVFEITP